MAEACNNKHEVVLCMGSACFTRGNKLSVEIVKDWLSRHDMLDKVVFKGCLCSENCKNAPNVKIDGKAYEAVPPQGIEELLNRTLTQK